MQNTPHEAELVEKIRLGDVESFSQLFRQLYGPLCLFARRMVSDLDAAENIVQDVFVRLWDNREMLFIHTGIRSYLYAAVKNSCINFSKHGRFAIPLDAETDRPDASEGEPDKQLESNELAQALDQAISALPPKCREIFLLAKFEGLSYEEIAEVQNISVNTVKTQLKRGLKALSKSLGYLRMIILMLEL